MSPRNMDTNVQRPIRFGHQIRPGHLNDVIAEARAAESAGFDLVSIPDHIGDDLLSPMIVLGAIAEATSTVRLGTFVLNNEMRNPVQLAWEATTLDRLSDGRFELGLGAGHTRGEFAAAGINFEPAGVRKTRLAEATEIIQGLLAGDTVSRGGGHYSIAEARIPPTVQDDLPLLVGGNGTALLSHAARHADIVGLNGLGRTLEDGQRHSVRFELDHLEAQLAVIAAEASGRDRAPELNALVQRVVVTDDREARLAADLTEVEGLTLEQAMATPYLAFGTFDEIAAQFLHARDRWGISYFSTRDIEAMQPIIERVRAAT